MHKQHYRKYFEPSVLHGRKVKKIDELMLEPECNRIVREFNLSRSNLSANGVPLDCIREMLGHSNLSTTLEYIYNPLTEKETYDLITKAL